jgi:hypothetical protein
LAACRRSKANPAQTARQRTANSGSISRAARRPAGQLRAVGEFVSGKMSGEWKWYRENGKLVQTGSFVEEKKSSIWKRFHLNGTLYHEGKFADNKKVGEWLAYDAKGKLIKITKHKNEIENLHEQRQSPRWHKERRIMTGENDSDEILTQGGLSTEVIDTV